MFQNEKYKKTDIIYKTLFRYIYKNFHSYCNSTMLTEILTIGIIIGSCGLIAWLAKNKFQPEIENDLKNREQKFWKLIYNKKKQSNYISFVNEKVNFVHGFQFL